MLSEQTRAKVRLYMGVTPKFPDVDSRLEEALDNMNGNPEDECLLENEIARCDSVQSAIDDLVGGCVKVVEVEGVQIRAAYGLQTLRSMGRQYVAALSRILGVPVVDGGYFSTTGASRAPGPFGSGDFPPYG